MRKFYLLGCVLCLLVVASTGWAGTQTPSTSKTVQDIIDEARIDLNDNSSTVASDADMIKWINSACIAIAAQARCLEFTDTLTLASQEMAYSPTTAHYDIETVFIDSGVVGNKDRWIPLEKVDPGSLYGRPKTVGIPSCWFEFAGRVNVWPIPSLETNGYYLLVFGIAIPTVINAASNVIQTPFYFDEFYVDYVKAKYWAKSNRPDRTAYYMARFETALIRYRTEVRRPLVYVEGK